MSQQTEPTTQHTQGGETIRDVSGLHLAHARVLDHERELLVIATLGGEIRLAAKADGCVLRPEKGDLVLACLAPGSGGSHILSVLRKAGGENQARSYDFGPGAALHNESGICSLQADSLHLSGRERASLEAKSMRLNAVDGEARFIRFSLAADTIHAAADKATTLLRSLDQRIERVMQRLGSCFRRVRGMEHVIAGRSSLFVHDRLTQKAKNASLTAKEHMDVNAEHINLG